MEDVLKGIMKNFSDKWNFKINTLFLKREKCITEAIVTRKKKYICFVESNEEVRSFKEKDGNRIYEPKFSNTGVDIIRSSTLPFARERMEILVKELLKNMNKPHIQEKYLQIKNEFFELVKKKDIYSIAIPSGVGKNPPDYTDMLQWPESLRKKVDWRLRAASVWNHLIDTDPDLSNLMLEPIYESSKVKFIKVHANPYGINTIAFIGNTCPDKLLKIFNPDWESQWETGFSSIMGRLFEAVGWRADLENDRRELMMEIF